MKSAIVRPTKPYLQKTLHFFSYRIAAYKNMHAQLFQNLKFNHKSQDSFCLTLQIRPKKEGKKLSSKKFLSILTDSNCGFVNVFSGTKVTPEQSHDLTFHKVSMKDIEILWYTDRILQHPSSSKAMVRKHRLLIMAPARIGKKRISQKEKEQKHITSSSCRFAWCNSTGVLRFVSRIILLPRALADCDSNTNKGSKAAWTKKLSDRYSNGCRVQAFLFCYR